MQKYIKKKVLNRLRSFYNIKIGLDLFLYSSFILNEKKQKRKQKEKGKYKFPSLFIILNLKMFLLNSVLKIL